MRYHNSLYGALLSSFVIFFPTCGMEQSSEKLKSIETQKKNLLLKIEEQQATLNTPIKPSSYKSSHFQFLINKEWESDPKTGTINSYRKLILNEAIPPYINQLVADKSLLIEKKLEEIDRLFGKHSLYTLQMIYKKNEQELREKNLLEQYRKTMLQKKDLDVHLPIKIESTLTQLPVTLVQQKTLETQPVFLQRELSIQPSENNNKITFNRFTYEKLRYDYQAYTDCQQRGIDCKIGDPFILVDVIVGKSKGVLMSLPLPLFIDDKGNIKTEIFLPFSKQPFIISTLDAEQLRKYLPGIAVTFYNTLKPIYNTTFATYLVEENILEKQEDGKYTHGPNGSKALLERYFKLWGIPEKDYKQPLQNWFGQAVSFVQNFITTAFNYIRALFRS